MRDDASTTDGRDESGPLLGLLARLAERVPVTALDELRVFPPRTIERGESRVVVASLFVNDDADRRRVFTAHYLARTDDRGRTDVQSAIAEHAVAPADRIGPVVDGVLRRLEDDLAEAPPETFAVEGDADRWAELLASLRPGDAEDAEGPEDAENGEEDPVEHEAAEGVNRRDGGEGVQAVDAPRAALGAGDAASNPTPAARGEPDTAAAGSAAESDDIA